MMETEAGHPNELDTGTVDTLSELIICGVSFSTEGPQRRGG